jgi:hypothetical protein
VRKLIITGALVLALAACASGGSHQATATSAPTTTVAPTTTAPETPEAAFLLTVQQAGFGDTIMDDPDNKKAIVSIGKHNVCELFDDGAGYTDIAEELLHTDRHPTGAQVKTFIVAAVENFCPRHVGEVPNP